MSLEPKYFAYAFAMSIATGALVPIFCYIMFCVTPKKLVYRFFRYPHFNFGEIAFMSQFPGSVGRTIIIAAAVACPFPYLTKRRGLERIRIYSPNWYILIASIFIGFICLQALFLLGSLTLWVLVDPDVSFVNILKNK